MKYLIIIVFLFALLVGCKNTSKKNLPEKMFSQTMKFDELNDVINTANKEQIASYYKIKFGEPEDAPYEVIKTYFNKSNKEIARTFYEDGTIVRSIIYKRNDANNISSITEMDYKTNQSRKTIAEFDIHTNIIKSTKYNSDGIIDSKKIFEYDNYSNKIKETHYNSRGSIISKWIYKYDSLNNVTEEFYYDSTDLRSKKESKYDSKGRKIEEIERKNYDFKQSKVNPRVIIDKGRTERKFRYNKNNKLISEYSKTFNRYNGTWKLFQDAMIQYSYDKDGRLIQERTKSPYSRNKNQPYYDRREESKYDDNGRLIELSRYTITKEDGKTLESKLVKKYNSNGDIIELRNYNNLGEIISFTKYEHIYLNR